MGNIIPYSVSNEDDGSAPNSPNPQLTSQQTNQNNIKFLTIPSIPKPEDRPFQMDKKMQLMSQNQPETMDLRPLIEKPYSSNHPYYQTFHANVEIVARQLECMVASYNAWKGRISRKFWDSYSKRTLTSIREIYDCVKKYGIIPESQEHKMELASTRVQARPYRLLILKMLSRDITLWQTFLAASCPIAISLAFYGDIETIQNVYEMPEENETLRLVIPALVVGYDQKREVFLVQGPFDSNWGEDGYIALPYEYIMSPSVVLEMWIAKFSKHITRTVQPHSTSKHSITDFDTISFDVMSSDTMFT